MAHEGEPLDHRLPFQAAPSSMRLPNSEAKTGRSERLPSPSRKAAASGFATCWYSSASRDAEALATQLALLVDGSDGARRIRPQRSGDGAGGEGKRRRCY